MPIDGGIAGEPLVVCINWGEPVRDDRSRRSPDVGSRDLDTLPGDALIRCTGKTRQMVGELIDGVSQGHLPEYDSATAPVGDGRKQCYAADGEGVAEAPLGICINLVRR